MPKGVGVYRSPYWRENQPGDNVRIKLGDSAC